MRRHQVMFMAILLLGLVWSAAALDQTFTVPPDAGTIRSSAVVGDEVLLSTSEGMLFACREGQSEPVRLASQVSAQDLLLLADGKTLYGLDQQRGLLYALAYEQDSISPGTAVTLQEDLYRQVSQEGFVSNIFLHGDKLYMSLLQAYQRNEYSLYSFDLRTGQGQGHAIEHLLYAAPYKEQQLLVTLHRPGRDEQTGEFFDPQLAAWSAEDETLHIIGGTGFPFTGNPSFLAYEPASDSIYLQGRREILRQERDGSRTVSAFLPFEDPPLTAAGQMLMLGPQRIALSAGRHLLLLSTEPANLAQGSLMVYSTSLEEAFQREAAIRLPGMRIETKTMSLDPSEPDSLQQLLLTGAQAADVFLIDSARYDWAQLMDKGYCADLSGSSVLQSFVGACYPLVRDAALHEDQLMMVPVSLRLPALRYAPQAFEEAGLPVPSSFSDLCAVLNGYDPLRHEGTLPLLAEDYRAWLNELALSLYADASDARGEVPHFSSPVLRNLLQEAAQPDVSAIPVQRTWEEMWAVQNDQETPLLMNAEGTVSLEGLSTYSDYRYGQLPLYLASVPGDEPPVPAELTLMFVNPRSSNVEQAIAYVEACVQALDAPMRIMLMPGQNDPVENPEYARTAQFYMDSLEQLRQQAAKAEGAERRQLDTQVAEQEKRNEEYLAALRYSVRPEGIARYRALMERAFLRTHAIQRLVHNENIQSLRQSYEQGQISLDQFLQEAENRQRLILLESR